MSNTSIDEKNTALMEVVSESLNEKDITMIDLGAMFLRDHPEHADYTEEEEKKAVRKMDWYIIPLLVVVNTLAAVDKVIISNAALYGMKEDCDLTGQRYSWVGSIFYFGYLAFEYPASLALQKWPLGKTLATSFICFSVVLLCMAGCNSFAGLAVTRFMLGIGEAFISPASILTLTMWYKKNEQPMRLSWVFSAFSSLIAGILCYGIGHAHSKVATWRIMFITLGAFSIVFSVFLYFVLPDNPMTSKYFTERQKYIIIHRTRANKTGTENKTFKKYQLMEALKDWKTWCVAGAALCINVTNGGLVTFSAQIVSGFGFNNLQTVLIGMPTGLIMTLATLMISLPLTYIKNYRTVLASIVCLIPFSCCIVMMQLGKRKSLLAAYYCFYFYWIYPTIITLAMANVSGYTKKVTVNSIIFISYCVANIIGPQFFLAKEAAEGYPTSYHSILGFLTATIVLLLAYMVGVKYENRKRDEKYGPIDGTSEKNTDENDELDLTDYEKAETFRYLW